MVTALILNSVDKVFPGQGQQQVLYPGTVVMSPEKVSGITVTKLSRQKFVARMTELFEQEPVYQRGFEHGRQLFFPHWS